MYQIYSVNSDQPIRNVDGTTLSFNTPKQAVQEIHRQGLVGHYKRTQRPSGSSWMQVIASFLF